MRFADALCERAEREQWRAILIDSTPFEFKDLLAALGALRSSRRDAALFVWKRYANLEERIWLYEAGADECVTDGFFPAEIATRLQHSIELRQAASRADSEPAILRAGDLELNLIRRSVMRAGRSIDLRPKEFLLLEYLMRNVNRPLTRRTIAEQAWHCKYEGLSNVVDVYISSLRQKIDKDFSPKLIKTSFREGYMLVVVGEEQRPRKLARQDLLSRAPNRPQKFSS